MAGTPSVAGPAAANSAPNCYGTNMADKYGVWAGSSKALLAAVFEAPNNPVKIEFLFEADETDDAAHFGSPPHHPQTPSRHETRPEKGKS